MIIRAASDTRLMGAMPPLISEPDWDWTRDAAVIAARAENLVINDPFAGAMVAAKILGTHGAFGLRLRSLAYAKDQTEVTDQERATRRTIEAGAAEWYGRAASSDGLLTRKQFDRALDWLATVRGEGWAIRCWKPGRKYTRFATCWRIVRPERICNPDDKPNSDRLYHGLELDADGEVIAVHVLTTRLGQFGALNKRTWTRVPLYAPDGTPNVVRRVGYLLPGGLRAFSMFTPMLFLAKQTAGVLEAHVTGKRAQACTPVIYYVDDPEEAARAHAKAYGSDERVSVVGPHTRFDPMTVYYAKVGQQVQFTNTNFQGGDLAAFLEVGHRLDCGLWQMPVEVVLAQMGKASLSSARAGLDQFARTCDDWDNDHEEQISRPVDQSFIREQEYNGEIVAGEAGIDGLCAGSYSRPPKYSTDRLKDANTMRAWLDVGRSYSAVFSEFGYNFQNEVEERKRDEEYLKAHGVKLLPAPTAEPKDAAPANADNPADDKKPTPDDGENAGGEDSSPAGDDEGANGDRNTDA